MSQPTITDMMVAYSEDALDLAKRMGIELDFSEESLKTLDRILEKYHQGIPKGIKKFFSNGPSRDQITQMSKIWGGYLGEVIRKHLGGEWGMSKHFENALALINNDSEIYPPAKVYKRLTNGAEDNVWFYYQVLKEEEQSIKE